MCAMFPGRTARAVVANTRLWRIVQIRTEGARFRHWRRHVRAIRLLRCPPFLLRQVWPSLLRALRPRMLLRRPWRRLLSALQVLLRLLPKQVLTMRVVFNIFGTFSFSRQSVRSSVVGERAGYFNLGAMFGSGKVGLTHLTRTFQFSCIFLNQFLLSCFPQGEWTSVCVARSVQTRVHSDSGNLPGSKNFSVSLGDFTGRARG